MSTIKDTWSRWNLARDTKENNEEADQKDKNQNVVGFIFDPSIHKIMVGFHKESEEVTPILSGHIKKGENRWEALTREAREETEGSRLYLLNRSLDNMKSSNIFDYFKIAHLRRLGHIERFYGFLLEAEDPGKLRPKGEEILRNRLGVTIYDWIGEEDLESKPYISSLFRKNYISDDMVSALSDAFTAYKTFRKRVDSKVARGLYNPALVRIDLQEAPEKLRNRREYLERILQK